MCRAKQNRGFRFLLELWRRSHRCRVAYAFDSCKGQGKLSKTDLGPKEIPGIESDLKHGSLLEDGFSELPVDRAINLWVENLDPHVQKAKDKKELSFDADDILVDLFQIWNYQIGLEACKNISSEFQDILKKENHFELLCRNTKDGRSRSV